MSKASTLSVRSRRIIVAAAAKLTSSSTPGEREMMFLRIDSELQRIGLRWDEVFERGLPAANPEKATPSFGNVVDAANSMMGDFASMMGQSSSKSNKARIRHLIGEEIPRTIMGVVRITDERDIPSGKLLVVEVSNQEFSYAPLVIFHEKSQELARISERDGMVVSGIVEQPRNPSRPGNMPVLRNISI